MPNPATSFPHIRLQVAREGLFKAPRGGGKKSVRTMGNSQNAGGHGRKLTASIDTIANNWANEHQERRKAQKPALPDAISFILQVDPDSFDADVLKGFGIEVIADLETGYILGASADIALSELRQKIQKFIDNERGGGKVPEIWEILEGTKRPDYILSEALKAEWSKISDTQEYIVEVGIACIDIQEQYTRCPKRRREETDKHFQQKVTKWLDKHKLTCEEWDDLYDHRSCLLGKFIEGYKGEILRNIAGEELGVSRLPDSFSCRIRIVGQGLRDLVLNFPYIFDVTEVDNFSFHTAGSDPTGQEPEHLDLEPPEQDAPKVCIIDSGIQERHPLLRHAVDATASRSWVPGDSGTADYVRGGGHGTRVAGAVLYPRDIPTKGQHQALCWLQNARILDKDNKLPQELFPPKTVEEIAEHYYSRTGTRIFNHSITGSVPCRTQSMSAWAAAIDKLTWEKNGDLLFIVAAGNLTDRGNLVTRPSISDHLAAGRDYPKYLLEDSARIANPAQSLQALTVGSVSQITYCNQSLRSIAEEDHCSSFSCTGFGIWNTIKPEVVEYGGDFVIDSANVPSLTTPQDVCPNLVRSIRDGGPKIAADTVGTSFAAPKVAHIAAALAAAYPNDSALFYRALIVQSARLPDWTREHLLSGIRTLGYGIPSLDRALGNSPNRITLTTQGDERIKAKHAKVYQVQIPEFVLQQGEGFEILIEVTLSYVAEPRRTRRNRRKYLSTWLDWDCSKQGESPDVFLQRILKDYEQVSSEADECEGLFQWTLGKKRKRTGEAKDARGIDGQVKEATRSSGTVQKDWAIVKSFNLREGFCIAVVGHTGWNLDPEASVPYALVVSFEALNTEISIYESFAQVQPPLEVQQRQRVEVTVST